MVIALVVVLVVVCVGGALLAYSRRERTHDSETQEQFLRRRELDRLRDREAEEQRRREELPPTHDT